MSEELKKVSITELSANPFQPRKTFDKDSIEEMAESIKSVGVMQPIVVRKVKDGYQIACGERRWRAAKKAGLDKVEVVIKELDDKGMMLYSLVENLHRKDLESEEREEAVHDLWKSWYEPNSATMEAMSTELGMNKNYVSTNIQAYERRNKMNLKDSNITTEDFKNVKGLDDKTAKKVLKAKANGDIEAKELRKIAPILKDSKPERRAAVVDEVVKTHKAAEKYKEDVREEAEAFGKGDIESTGIKVVKSADLKRVDKFKEVHDDIKWWTIANIELIENDLQKVKAVEYLEGIEDHCEKLILLAKKRDWYAGSK